MAALKQSAITLLATKTSVDMKTAASTALFVTDSNVVTRISHIVVRNASGTLAGGTSYSVTDFAQTFSLANLTSTTGYVVIPAASGTQYTQIAGGTTVQFTVTTGATSAATATIDVFGYEASA